MTMQAPSHLAIFVSSISTAKSYRQNQLLEMMEIGKWHFGTVYKAKLQLPGNRYKVVTVKVPTEVAEAYSEKERLAIMNHQNVLKFIGLAHCANTPPWLIVEYMEKGNLKEYIKFFQTDWNGLTKMAYGIASAMNYLHGVSRAVHGDLAARNILVGANNLIKLTDFGLYNTSYPKVYTHDIAEQPCPIRWMPPENYPEPKVPAKFTKKGDIWAFGIVCCELWMHGAKPFGKMCNEDVMHNVRTGASPLEFMAVEANPFIIDIMNECFKFIKHQRPTFSQILCIIRENVSPNIIA